LLTIKNNNGQGILLMVMSMGAFALADTLVKVSTSFLSSAQVLFYLIAGALVAFTLIAKLQGNRLIDRRVFTSVLLLRYLAEIVGMVGMVTALTFVPISTVGAITQATPVVATLGAVLFLRENIGWRRWATIVCGFIGVLLIVQPVAAEFDLAVLWAVVAMVALSVRDVTTRLVPADMASTSLATYTMAAALPFTIGWVLFNGDSFVPASTNWAVVVPMVILGAAGYLLLTASLRTAEVSVVMPFRYTRILFLLALGMLVFGERPNVLMLLGVLVVVVSGIYMVWRERVIRRRRVLTLTLNGPESRNSVGPDVYNAIRNAVVDAGNASNVRAIVITGAGGFFSSGGNINALKDSANGPLSAVTSNTDKLNAMIRAIVDCPTPVIAAVEGGAAGAGVALALSCDFVVAARDAKFIAAYVKVGLSPDGGVTYFLRRGMPRQLVNELCILGRPVTADRLAEFGLVNELAEKGQVIDAATALADRIAAGPSQAIQSIKHLVNAAEHNELCTHLWQEADRINRARYGAEAAEGLQAFLEKRKPDFSKL